MKRKIFSQFSLLLAIFTIIFSLSACSSNTIVTKTTTTNNEVNNTSTEKQQINSSSVTNYNQGEIPMPRTRQS